MIVCMPASLACPVCSVLIATTLSADLSGGPALRVALSADAEKATVAMVDHVYDTHGRDAVAGLAPWITEQLDLALAGARVDIEGVLAAVGFPVTPGSDSAG